MSAILKSAGATSLVLLSILEGACTVGPSYQGPPPTPTAVRFTRTAAVVGATQAAPAPRWWESLNDPILTRLITRALGNNPDLDVAEARLRTARYTVAEQRAGLFPQASASALGGRMRVPDGALEELSGNAGAQSVGSGHTGLQEGGSGHTDVSLYDVGFDASWEMDLVGGTRRAIEGAKAQAEAEQARLADVHVQIAAQVAQAYVMLRDAQHQAELVRHSIDLEQHIVDLTQIRREAGTAAQTDLERVQLQLLRTSATLSPLQAREEQYLDELATLSGLAPGALDDELRAPAAVPLPPASVAIGDPAGLLRQRPDIRAAERELAASNAQIGTAVAQYFPSVRLLGTLGFVSTDTTHLLDNRNLTAAGPVVLSWNLLDFGRTRAKVHEAESSRDETLARYRSVVLSALQDAETSLSRYGRERDHVIQLTAAQAAATRAAVLTRQRHEAGTASVIDVLDVERQRVATEQDLAQAQAALTSDFVALQKALGLGWSFPTAAGTS